MGKDAERYDQLEREADQESRRLVKTIRENEELRARITELERELENLDARTNVKPNNPCPACSGYGLKTYGDTTTWMHGIGGQMMTEDVCDTCWGSGTTDRTGTDLRKVKAHIAKLERERDAARAEVKLWEKRDEVKAMSHELAVRERQAEILAGEGWSNGKTVEPFKSERLSKALAQARVELAKETTIARVDEIEEAYHSADDSKLVFKEVKP